MVLLQAIDGNVEGGFCRFVALRPDFNRARCFHQGSYVLRPFLKYMSPCLHPATIPLMLRTPGPLLVRLALLTVGVFSAEVPKVKLDGDRLTTGAPIFPCRKDPPTGLPLPLSLMLSDAVRTFVVVGVKVTLMVQVAFTARVAGLAGQLLVCV
jgi:hypothetical protein